MKLPVELGVALFFRLLIPGALVAAALAPLVLLGLHSLSIEGRTEIALTAVAVLAGWGLLLFDMPVYMLLEGRSGWPSRLSEWCRRRAQRRLDRDEAIIERYGSDSTITARMYEEASVRARWFPFDARGDRIAEFPTRLGNLIAAFESYADTRYGVDTIFFWPRIRLQLSKEAREDLENAQALADSAVYSVVALSISAVAWLAYAAVTPVAAVLPFGLLPVHAVAFAVISAVLARCAYIAALHANAQFGELFQAVFDRFGSNPAKIDSELLNVSGVLGLVAAVRPASSRLAPATQQERLNTVWMYLKNFRVECPRCGEPVRVPKFGSHLAAHLHDRQPEFPSPVSGVDAPMPRRQVAALAAATILTLLATAAPLRTSTVNLPADVFSRISSVTTTDSFEALVGPLDECGTPGARCRRSALQQSTLRDFLLIPSYAGLFAALALIGIRLGGRRAAIGAAVLAAAGTAAVFDLRENVLLLRALLEPADDALLARLTLAATVKSYALAAAVMLTSLMALTYRGPSHATVVRAAGGLGLIGSATMFLFVSAGQILLLIAGTLLVTGLLLGKSPAVDASKRA